MEVKWKILAMSLGNLNLPLFVDPKSEISDLHFKIAGQSRPF